MILNVIMKYGWIQNDERRVLMDDRLLGHRAFPDLSFTQKNILTIQIWPSTLLYFIYLCYQSTEIQMAIIVIIQSGN